MGDTPCLNLSGKSALRSVKLLGHRRQLFRLDVGPFLTVYAGIFCQIVSLALDGRWDKMTLLHFQLGAIAVIHVLLMLFAHWSVWVRTAVAYVHVKDISQANAVQARLSDYAGTWELVPLSLRTLVDGSSEYDEIGFEVRKEKYIYSITRGGFEMLQYPTQEPLSHYEKSLGYETEAKAMAALQRWGPNIFEVPVPQFSTLLKGQLLAPFFVFQVFCVGLWCMDEYWKYSMFTLFMLVVFECTVVAQRLKNLKELRNLQTAKQILLVMRYGKWERVRGEELLPGDVISIGRPHEGYDEQVVPADAVLIAGTCIVDESVLTGESTPQWKSPLSAAIKSGTLPSSPLDIEKRDKPHVLFGGTKILQHTGDKTAHIKPTDGGCVAVVLRTGFETAQGRLMRTILYSTEQVTANNWETGLFILFLLVWAVAAAAYVLYHGFQDPSRPRFKLFLNCSMIITSVIPPELPMELSIAVNHSLMALAKKRVFCIEPFRIPFAGKVDVCCFDKTGTLTSDHLILEGVAAAPGMEEDIICKAADLPNDVTRVLALCHSLVQLDGQLIGDPLEKAAFEATEWSYSGDSAAHRKKKERAQILHRFHFSSSLKRMSVVIRVDSQETGGSTHYVVAKGAPEVIETRLRVVPDNYRKVYKGYAAKGGRVIALAHRQLQGDETDRSILRGAKRDDAEQGLDFAGFAVFQCPLKPESESALRMLVTSSHRVVMITGDAALTACYAASQVHIVTRPVLILTTNSGKHQGNFQVVHGAIADYGYEWVSPDEATRIPFSRQQDDILELAQEWDLCIVGDALGHLERARVASFLIPLAQVFARVAPDHKELVVNILKQTGAITLMCGDGTNDVGGLKAAHVGVALLSPKGLIDSVKKKVAAKRKQKEAATARESAQTNARQVSKSKAAAAPTGSSQAQKLLTLMEKEGKPIPPAVRKMIDMMDELEDAEVPLVKPGDASMAAPFTAKHDSVMPCTELIKQGRCTLVSTVQMFKILGLMSLSSAYSLSVMYLQGVKIGDAQATVTGLLSAGMFFFLSASKPLNRLSSIRPHPDIFSLYVFLSVLGQFAAHSAFLIYMYQCALAYADAGEKQTYEQDFKPNLVNSICFVVNFIILIITFTVNYAGPPFVTAIRDNTGLFKSLSVSSMVAFALVTGIVPGLCNMLEMVPIPASLRMRIIALWVLDHMATNALERGLRRLFPARLPPRKGQLMHNRGRRTRRTNKKRD